MRVDGLGRAQAAPSGAQRTSGTTGGFRLPDAPGAGTARSAAPLRQAPSLDALIALQEMIEPPGERRRKAVKRGRDLLDALDELKLAVLDDRVDARTLAALSSRLAGPRDGAGDPGLDDTLAAIDLRVRVELAKRQARNGAIRA